MVVVCRKILLLGSKETKEKEVRRSRVNTTSQREDLMIQVLVDNYHK